MVFASQLSVLCTTIRSHSFFIVYSCSLGLIIPVLQTRLSHLNKEALHSQRGSFRPVYTSPVRLNIAFTYINSGGLRTDAAPLCVGTMAVCCCRYNNKLLHFSTAWHIEILMEESRIIQRKQSRDNSKYSFLILLKGDFQIRILILTALESRLSEGIGTENTSNTVKLR